MERRHEDTHFGGLVQYDVPSRLRLVARSLRRSGQEGRGRYSGIGIYEAGRLWSQAKVDPATQMAGKAGLADDEHVIVVVDSRTGEVRQCGDHSGVCVAMNPWSGGRSATKLPVELTKNAADLDAEQESPLRETREASPSN